MNINSILVGNRWLINSINPSSLLPSDIATPAYRFDDHNIYKANSPTKWYKAINRNKQKVIKNE